MGVLLCSNVHLKNILGRISSLDYNNGNYCDYDFDFFCAYDSFRKKPVTYGGVAYCNTPPPQQLKLET